MTLVFLPRYREMRKLPPSPRWSPLQGIPCKGQAPGRVISWIAPGLPHTQLGLRCAFRQASPRPLPTVFTIKLSAEPPQALFPLVHGGGHTTNTVGVVLQNYKPLLCTTMIRSCLCLSRIFLEPIGRCCLVCPVIHLSRPVALKVLP